MNNDEPLTVAESVSATEFGEAVEPKRDVYATRRDNLRALARAFDSRAALADRLGTSTVQLNHIIGKNPVKNLGEKLARRWEERLDLEVGALDRPGTYTVPTLNRGIVAMEGGRYQQEVVTIPIFQVQASMGVGLPMPDQDTVIDSIRVPQAWVRDNLPHITSPKNLKVITGYGDSMEDTFSPGDPLIIDTGVRDIKIDAIYMFALHSELYIKRVQRLPGGGLKVISDNKKYDAVTLTDGDREALRVLGRVVYRWSGKKL